LLLLLELRTGTGRTDGRMDRHTDVQKSNVACSTTEGRIEWRVLSQLVCLIAQHGRTRCVWKLTLPW